MSANIVNHVGFDNLWFDLVCFSMVTLGLVDTNKGPKLCSC